MNRHLATHKLRFAHFHGYDSQFHHAYRTKLGFNLKGSRNYAENDAMLRKNPPHNPPVGVHVRHKASIGIRSRVGFIGLEEDWHLMTILLYLSHRLLFSRSPLSLSRSLALLSLSAVSRSPLSLSRSPSLPLSLAPSLPLSPSPSLSHFLHRICLSIGHGGHTHLATRMSVGHTLGSQVCMSDRFSGASRGAI